MNVYGHEYRRLETVKRASRGLKRLAIWLAAVVVAAVGIAAFAFWFDSANNVGVLAVESNGGGQETDLRHWRTVPGVVVSVSESGGRSSLRFEYKAGLVSYSAVSGFEGKPPYAPGTEVTVRHDPMMPRIAVVEPGTPALPVDTSLAGIFYRPDVRGRVTSYSPPDSDGYSKLSFTYAVRGVSYSGEQRLHKAWALPDPSYSPGSEVRVKYEPVEPSLAVVEYVRQTPGEDGQLSVVVLTFLLALGLAAAAAVLLVVIIVRALVYAWRVHRWSGAGPG